MKTVTTENCPRCSADLVSEVQTFRATRDLPGGVQDMTHVWMVTCTNGHEHRVVGCAQAFNRSPARWELVLPELVQGDGMVVRDSGGPCVSCGEPIGPGQAYASRPVRHLGCGW